MVTAHQQPAVTQQVLGGEIMSFDLDDDSLQELYSWVDKMPLSRPKRNVTRDFSDGVLAAEIVNFHFPKLVEMHNYVPASSTQQKVDNWSQLNRKVFNRLSFSVPEDQIRKITQCSPGVVEQVLSTLREKIEQKQKTSKLPPQNLEYYSTTQGSNEHGTGYSSQVPKAKDSSTAGNLHSKQGLKPVSPGRPHPATITDSTTQLHLQEKEQALIASRETIQILQAKVRRLEHLVHLKDVRLDDLTRRLQQGEQRHK
ncbi:sperm flagellar protein 1-like isoform X4 [Huso huso]|uniref:Sperm flagellar protein 1-like isoform X4 n=1 Tax=Huso huso TaxID=61971 RepID=A0ABR1A9A4_HUSHU